MAGRGPQSFKKRQREQLRKEKQDEKRAKRIERKLQGPAPEGEDSDLELGMTGGLDELDYDVLESRNRKRSPEERGQANEPRACGNHLSRELEVSGTGDLVACHQESTVPQQPESCGFPASSTPGSDPCAEMQLLPPLHELR